MHYDLIAVGLGAMGSAVLYQAAKAGHNVLGIDRFDPPHNMGSSHAETRITRLAAGEGPEYLPLVARSHEIWRELEAQTGETLLYQCGLYIINPQKSQEQTYNHWENFVERTATIAQQANIPYTQPSPAEVRQMHPQILIRDCDMAGHEASGGVALAERAVRTQLALAQKLGATTKVNEPVADIEFGQDAATVVTENGRYSADKVIVTAGAWMPDFLPTDKRNLLRVTRQIVHWFEVDDPTQFYPENFPGILWIGDTLADYLGVFPIIPDGIQALKVLTEQYDVATDPMSVNRMVTEAESAAFYQNVLAPKIGSVTSTCVKAEVCLYTHTPNDHFLIDYYPKSNRVLLASPCSSHGFKHSAAIGEALMQQATTGKSSINLGPFSFERFA